MDNMRQGGHLLLDQFYGTLSRGAAKVNAGHAAAVLHYCNDHWLYKIFWFEKKKK